jgi:hypothetical protein
MLAIAHKPNYCETCCEDDLCTILQTNFGEYPFRACLKIRDRLQSGVCEIGRRD